MSREEVHRMVSLLHDAQKEATEQILETVNFENLEDVVPDGVTVDGTLRRFTVNDILRMWVWHFWAHHRELILARGPLENDNPHFHVPHFVRQANEEFGRFAGELACLTDEQLDLRPPEGGRTIREIVEHVLDTLTGYLPDQVARCRKP